MASYGSKQQNMDSKWQIARKVDRLDLGTFAALEFFYRCAIIFGIVRAMDPEEKTDEKEDRPKPDKTIQQLIESVDNRIKELQDYDTTALLMGKMQLKEVREFQKKTLSVWYELYEIIHRCKLTDNVRVQGEEI